MVLVVLLAEAPLAFTLVLAATPLCLPEVWCLRETTLVLAAPWALALCLWSLLDLALVATVVVGFGAIVVCGRAEAEVVVVSGGAVSL